MHDMFRRERKGTSGLEEIVADGNLPAERITPSRDMEAIEIVRIALNQHGHVELRQLQGFRDSTFIAEIREHDENAQQRVAMPAKQRGALARIGEGLHAAELRRLRIEHHRLDS